VDKRTLNELAQMPKIKSNNFRQHRLWLEKQLSLLKNSSQTLTKMVEVI